jgi:hypothetical protein
VPLTAIREVIFGCKAEQPLVDDLLGSVKANLDVGHLAFFHATLLHAQFEMDISPVPQR